MLRPLQSTSSHVSISVSIFLLNIHPEFTSGSPRFFRPVHRSLATRLSVVWSSLLRSEHARCFPSRWSLLRWRFVQRPARDAFTAAPCRPGRTSSSESCSLSQTVVYIVSFYGPALQNVFLMRGLILAHGSLLGPELCQVNGNRSVQFS